MHTPATVKLCGKLEARLLTWRHRKGTFAEQVYKAVLDTTLDVAVKRLHQSNMDNKAHLDTFTKEVAFMHACRSALSFVSIDGDAIQGTACFPVYVCLQMCAPAVIRSSGCGLSNDCTTR